MIPPYRVSPISEDFRVVVETAPLYAPIPADFSDEVFERASEEKPIFNGLLLAVKDVSPNKITTYTLSFKEFLASNIFPDYPHTHKILAVSGWVIHNKRVLMGIRSNQVSSYPGYLELVPSGGIDAESISDPEYVDYKFALITEFEEETGMSESQIEKIVPEILVYCPAQDVYDIGLSIHLVNDESPSCETSNDEYSQLFWIPLAELRKFVEENRPRILPTSLALIHHKILS